MELGIIGLSKSGKTTVFNALTRGHSQALAKGRTPKASVGIAKVPDLRLTTLVEMFVPERVVEAEVSYTDIPSAPEGLGKSSSIGGEYLGALQRVDALIHVTRDFDNPSVPHIESSVDPYRDVETMDLELAISDLAILERRADRLATEFKGARAQERERIRVETQLIERLKDALAKGTPVRQQELSDEDRRMIRGYQFLTAKPFLILFNVDESKLAQMPSIEEEMSHRLEAPLVGCAAVCGSLEAELVQMDKAEELEFRQSLAAGESGASKVVQLSYGLVGLSTFFTVGQDEVKAWSIPVDISAAKAAGTIHSDIERGFIRAEVIAYQTLIECGSLTEARRRGVLRAEGRNYSVQDGDVINFLFNV
jgi:GTP-binding protein YchF